MAANNATFKYLFTLKSFRPKCAFTIRVRAREGALLGF